MREGQAIQQKEDFMNRIFAVGFFLCALFVLAMGQENIQATWRMTPGVVYVRHFPGPSVASAGNVRYSASGFSLRTRLFNDETPFVSYTLGGGVNWYSSREREVVYSTRPADAQAIGQDLKGSDFTVFPLSLGVQWTFPRLHRRDFFAYVGAEGVMNFVDGRIDMSQQVKPGYAVLAGFSVKQFEFGVHYVAFSDMKNLGVSLGLRFATFDLE